MREILFRGKRKNNRGWVCGSLVKKISGAYIISESITGCIADYIEHEVYPETVCQYTGTEDKNGKSIFEGDIVRAIYKPKDEDLTTDDFIIKWDKYYCKYVGHYAKKENVYNPLLFGSQTSFEVIGNIFDNPELTKE